MISNEILQEYLEIIEEKTTANIAENFAELLLKLENVKRIEVHFRWNLILNDPDDNKFVDCAVASGARYLVTNDKHFNVLKEINFPPVDIISADQLLDELLEL